MIKRLIPHICIIFSLATLTFLVLAQFNPIWGKSFVQIVVAITGVASITAAAYLIADNRRR